MTPKQKAAQLFNKYCYAIRVEEDNSGYFTNIFYSKQCALIAVDEILTARPLEPNNVDWDDCGAAHQYWYEEQTQEALNYWQEVKEEIEKL